MAHTPFHILEDKLIITVQFKSNIQCLRDKRDNSRFWKCKYVCFIIVVIRDKY